MCRLLLIIGMAISFMTATAQQNQRIIDSTDGQEILIGICSPKAFYQTPFSTWYIPAFEGYSINPKMLELLPARLHLPGISITVIFGTCNRSSQLSYTPSKRCKINFFFNTRTTQSKLIAYPRDIYNIDEERYVYHLT